MQFSLKIHNSVHILIFKEDKMQHTSINICANGKAWASIKHLVRTEQSFYIYIRWLDDINVQACSCDSLYRTVSKFSFLPF